MFNLFDLFLLTFILPKRSMKEAGQGPSKKKNKKRKENRNAQQQRKNNSHSKSVLEGKDVILPGRHLCGCNGASLLLYK